MSELMATVGRISGQYYCNFLQFLIKAFHMQRDRLFDATTVSIRQQIHRNRIFISTAHDGMDTDRKRCFVSSSLCGQ